MLEYYFRLSSLILVETRIRQKCLKFIFRPDTDFLSYFLTLTDKDIGLILCGLHESIVTSC